MPRARLHGDGGRHQSTLELDVRFLRPVRPGRVIGKGRVVRRDGDTALIDLARARSAA